MNSPFKKMSVEIFPSLFPIDPEGSHFEGFISVQGQEFVVSIDFPVEVFGKEKQKSKKRRKTEELEEKKNEEFRFQCCPQLSLLLKGMEEILLNRLKSSPNVTFFLLELKEILEKRLGGKREKHINSSEFYNRLRWEMEQIGWDRFKSMNKSFSQLELESIDKANRVHSIVLELSSEYPNVPPTVIADLPEMLIPKWNSSSNSLLSLLLQIEKTLDDYQPLWNQLKDLDENCWILEPERPSFSSLSRRIALEQHRSLQIKLDPTRPFSIPEIQFLGPDATVSPLRETFNRRLASWNTKLSLRENLEKTIGISFPSPKTSKKEEFSQECGICYSYKLEHEGNLQIPDRVCVESKCAKPFHPFCLYEWLRSNPSCRQSFNTIFGECPYCSTPISIKL